MAAPKFIDDMKRLLCFCLIGDEPEQPVPDVEELPRASLAPFDGRDPVRPASAPASASTSTPADLPGPSSAAPPTNQLCEWPFDELERKTNQFSEDYLIGYGSRAKVYLVLVDQKQLAVKYLHRPSHPEPSDDFLRQVTIASKLKHPNLVDFLGYSVRDDLRLLVYECATIGSLHHVLHGTKGVQYPGPALSWRQRLRIAINAAKGIEYLHEKAQPSRVHMHITSSHILLFENYTAKISDFDLSDDQEKPKVPDRLHTTEALGPFSYEAPEYAMSDQMTKKSDIYSFGVVLLELLTGRKPIDITRPVKQQSLILWASPRLTKSRVPELVDPGLEGNYPPEGLIEFAAVAASCIECEANLRPNMTTVIKKLCSLFFLPPKPTLADNASTKHQLTRTKEV